jgi:hypothetical protein
VFSHRRLCLTTGALGVGHAVCVVFSLAGCSSPTHPSVSVASGRPVSPTNGAQFSYYSQPITLVVANGVATGGASTITAVEIATDAAFTAVVTTQTVSPGANGQPSITLDHLAPATTYYWRVKTAAGSNPGVSSSPVAFSIGPLLVIQRPVPAAPLADSFPHKRPTFTVMNAARTGPPATVTYRFDVATDAAFGNIVATGAVPEGASETSFTPTVDLVPGTSYVWRVQASDTAKGVTSVYSTAQPFTTVFPEDGSFRYTLVVRSPSWCLTHFSGSSYCSPPSEWYKSDFSFDGLLVVEGDTLRYNLVPVDGPLVNEGPFRLEIRRTSNRLAGSVSGTTADTPPVAVASFTLSGMVTGEADNRGHFSGAFDGRMTLWHFGFPCDKTEWCSTSGFVWTLTPH